MSVPPVTAAYRSNTARTSSALSGSHRTSRVRSRSVAPLEPPRTSLYIRLTITKSAPLSSCLFHSIRMALAPTASPVKRVPDALSLERGLNTETILSTAFFCLAPRLVGRFSRGSAGSCGTLYDLSSKYTYSLPSNGLGSTRPRAHGLLRHLGELGSSNDPMGGKRRSSMRCIGKSGQSSSSMPMLVSDGPACSRLKSTNGSTGKLAGVPSCWYTAR